MIYTQKQLALMRLWQKNQLKRINILEGSVSSGKTWISLVLWSFWLHDMPDSVDSLYLMSARSLTTLKRNCLLPLQGLLGESNFKFSISAKEGWLFGRHILLEGANDAQAEAKIRGLTLQGAYVDEATKLPEDFWVMLLSRLRKPKAKLFATTNPDRPGHWLKKKYIERAGELDLLDVFFQIDDNTTLPKEYIENIKLEYTGVYYDRFIKGLWVLAEGLIYPQYKEALEMPPDRKADQYTLSIDYGTQNPFAAVLWGKYGNVWYAVDLYYHNGRETAKQKTDDDYGRDLDKFVEDIPRIDKLKTIVDPSAASFIAVLKRKPWCKVIKADNDVIDGIRETAAAIHTGKIKINPELKPMIDEFESYVWDESETIDKPVKENDHCMDAIRYHVRTMKIMKQKREYKSPFEVR
jgi:PBSX family phage terminase large subunit